ncbi:hypothetical protein [uncultured Hymenobacter sp.]|uniref:hypothetical protein n=1 Tax=uncultured Hymenobacter sp. TaxID=170016 RepID=UPI0035CC55E3
MFLIIAVVEVTVVAVVPTVGGVVVAVVPVGGFPAGPFLGCYFVLFVVTVVEIFIVAVVVAFSFLAAFVVVVAIGSGDGKSRARKQKNESSSERKEGSFHDFGKVEKWKSGGGFKEESNQCSSGNRLIPHLQAWGRLCLTGPFLPVSSANCPVVSAGCPVHPTLPFSCTATHHIQGNYQAQASTLAMLLFLGFGSFRRRQAAQPSGVTFCRRPSPQIV